MNILSTLLVTISTMFLATNAQNCGFTSGSTFRSFIPKLGRVCDVCRTIARKDTFNQNKSFRTKIACIGLVKHNCCAGLITKRIRNIELSYEAYRTGYARDFESVSLGFLVLS